MNLKKLGAGGVAQVASRLGLARLQRRLRTRRRDFRVLILEYHAVEAEKEEEGSVSRRRFRRHLEWLAARWRCATVERAAEKLQGGLEEDLVVLTFDDGYANNARIAFPILEELGLSATIYLATNFLDGQELWFDLARRGLRARQGADLPAASRAILARLLGAWPSSLPLEQAMRRLKDAPAAERLAAVEALRPLAAGQSAKEAMTWQEARALQAAGIELGAHTLAHPILSRLSEAEQENEIALSVQRIEKELGRKPRTFAIPNGGRRDYDDATLRVVRRLGLLASCTTRRGSNAAGCDLHQLRRIGVGSDSLGLLDARLAGFFDEGLRRFFFPSARS